MIDTVYTWWDVAVSWDDGAPYATCQYRCVNCNGYGWTGNIMNFDERFIGECPHCHATMLRKAWLCPDCGKPKPNSGLCCENCGSKTIASHKYSGRLDPRIEL